MAKRNRQEERATQQDGTIAVNRRARHDYDVLLELDAGLVLIGPEIKSIRAGRVNIAEGFARFRDGELWLQNVHIAPYEAAARANPEDPRRPRKLLLHRAQLMRLQQELDEQPRATLIPLRLYFVRGRVKVQLGLVHGRREYDKRQAIAKRDAERSIQRALRHAQR